MTQRGRPRSTQADERILQAAHQQLLAHGYTDFTVEKATDHAGVAKTTLGTANSAATQSYVPHRREVPTPPGTVRTSRR